MLAYLNLDRVYNLLVNNLTYQNSFNAWNESIPNVMSHCMLVKLLDSELLN